VRRWCAPHGGDGNVGTVTDTSYNWKTFTFVSSGKYVPCGSDPSKLNSVAREALRLGCA
jgi:hypothetical protein